MIRTIQKVSEQFNGSIDYNYNNGDLIAPCVGVITDKPNDIIFTFIENRWRKPFFNFLENGKAAVYWPGIHYTDEQLKQIENDPTIEPELIPRPKVQEEEEEQECRTTIKKKKVVRPRKKAEPTAPKTKVSKPSKKDGEMTDKQKVVFELITKFAPITVDGLVEKDTSFTKKGMIGVVASLSRKGVIVKVEGGWTVKV